MEAGIELREEILNLVWVREICLQQDDAPSKGFNFHLSLTRRVERLMIMENDVESMLRERQSEDLSQPMRRASDKGER